MPNFAAAWSTMCSATATAIGAVLAHHRLVLEHHRALGAVLRVLVGSSGQIEDLVALDPGRSREHRVRSDAREVVDLERRHVAVAVDGELRLHAVIARMDVGEEGFEAIGGELHRAPEHERKRACGDLVAVRVDLDAEGAADVARDDAHAVLIQRKPARDDPLHHVRRLAAVIHGHALFRRVVVGEDGARLHGDAGVAAETDRVLDHEVRGFHRGVHAARVYGPLEAKVAVEPLVDLRLGWIESALRVERRGQLLVCDLDHFDGILGLGARMRDHRDYRFALPARDVDGERVLRRRAHSLQVSEHSDIRFAHQGDLGAGDDAHHARHRRGFLGLDSHDLRVRVGGPHVGHVHHTGKHDIVDILAAALRETPRVGARDRAPDVAVGRIEIERLRRFVEFAHRPRLPARALATASIASTMDW